MSKKQTIKVPKSVADFLSVTEGMEMCMHSTQVSGERTMLITLKVYSKEPAGIQILEEIYAQKWFLLQQMQDVN